ncbi:hypothetical protein MBLNU457_1964t1 [Dothideomycetes sp. NU457]
MSSLRPMGPMDLLKFNQCNLDHLTETYNINFYLEYFTKWPQLCLVLEDRHGQIEGYILGKLESSPYNPAPHIPYSPSHPIYANDYPNYLPWHAHITCLTVSPSARRLGHATRLSSALEAVGEKENCWFVDLFVREGNTAAIELYKGMGYSVYRRVVGYYGDGEDAFDMRKRLGRDVKGETLREKGEEFRVDPEEVW